jgi:hypothetical protein
MYLDGQGDGFGVEDALFNILFNFYKLVCYLSVMERSTLKKKKKKLKGDSATAPLMSQVCHTIDEVTCFIIAVLFWLWFLC